MFTIKEYLYTLLSTLWDEQDSFSGKRPFGNSGWEHDLFIPLIHAKAVDGTLDEDGYIQSVDQNAAHAKICEVVNYIFEKK